MEQSKTCPECNNTMNKRNFGQIIIDECSNCKWIFLDSNEITYIWEIFEKCKNTTNTECIEKWEQIQNTEKQIYDCANCWKKMVENNYLWDSWIFIDFCNNCHSMYLNKWELVKIKNYITSLENSAEWKSCDIVWKEYYKIEKDKYWFEDLRERKRNISTTFLCFDIITEITKHLL